ncbi:hypothetical protein KR018_009350 [Drosophila ironensis]|nr:hypothetical protein KR018_009350 [Drosophila ironensis]
MAQNAPDCKDTQDFQFKKHDKFVAFKKCGEPRSNVKLLAISSSRGLLFAGNPSQPELKVIVLKDLVSAKFSDRQPLARLVALPSIANYISCSSDGNLLAINHTHNGTSLLSIYAVPAFMTPDIRPVYSIRLAPEDYVHAVQLLWNPVLPSSLAVVLSNGGLGMYSLKEGGNVELHSLDKSQQVKCGCWSPKGKQIVLGFPNGRLQQFKPDLTPAKTIVCPPNVHDAPFDTIAVQWLSTYQFAVIFLQHGEDCNPSLYILNAPKAGPPAYINYYDICYSLNGPRNHQFLFNHVPQWNVLLVTSANGVEVGVMGTAETGDTPAWHQYALLDEARIELPLSEGTQEETFPLGFVYDTSSTHQLTINEQKLQPMPMVHVLGSDGALLSFNFLNLVAGAASVCSPPPPVADTSGLFRALNTLVASEKDEEAEKPAPALASPPAKEPQAPPAPADISFAFSPNTVTSTPAPAKEKPASMFSSFGAPAAKPPGSQLTFGGGPANAPLSFAAPAAAAAKPALGFGGFAAPTTAPVGSMFAASGGNTFGGLTMNKPSPAPAAAPLSAAAPALAPASAAAVSSALASNPLYTVPATYTPPTVKEAPGAGPAGRTEETFRVDDTEPIIKDMIAVQIEDFSYDIQKQKEHTKQLLASISAPSELRTYAKRLDDLQELNEQANDVEFELDVQGLRQGLNESYAIVAECRGKLDMYKKPDITRLMNSSACDPAGRRMITRLQSYVAANEAQLHQAQQFIDLQWEQYQDAVRRNSKTRMHIPCLEGIYQRLTRLQNMASDQRILHNNIKAKLKERGLLQVALLDQDASRSRTSQAVDTLADSILTMSLTQSVDANAAKLTKERLSKIRHAVQHQKIKTICPQRPDRVGLKSEVILETKRKQEQIKKKAAKPLMANKSTQSAGEVSIPPAAAPAAFGILPTPAPGAPVLPKPMPSKPTVVPVAPAVPATSVAAPMGGAFSFGQGSPFGKGPAVNAQTSGEAAKPGLPMFGGLGSGGSGFNFGGGAKTTLSFGAQPAAGQEAPKTSLFQGLAKEQPTATKPPVETAKPKEPVAVPQTKAPPEPTKADAPATPKADTSGKSLGFAGFKTPSGSSNSSFGFGGMGTSLGTIGGSPAATSAPATAPSFGPFSGATTKPSSGAPTVTSSSSTTTKPMATAAQSLPAAAPPVSSSSDPVGGLFASVNICKPNTKETTAGNAKPIFGGFGSTTGGSSFSFGGVGEKDSKGLFGGIQSAPAATTAAPFTAATVAATPAVTTVAGTATKSEPVSTTAAAATPVSSPLSAAPPATAAAPPATAAAPAAAAPATTAPGVATSAAATTSAPAAPGSEFSFSNAFSNLSTGTTSAPAAATTSATPAGPFSFSNAFGSSTASPATAAAAPFAASPSGASTASNASVFGGFGGGAAAAAGAGAGTPAAAAATGASAPFKSPMASPAPSGNIFGNVPKAEDANIFGTAATATAAAPAAAASPPTGLFASASISNQAPFGSPQSGAAASGGNIFGQAIKPSGFGQPAVPSPAGGAAAGGSIFGGATTAAPFGSSSIFGGGGAQSPPAAAAGGGSIFGQNVFGQAAQAAAPAAGGNIFANSPQQQQPQASAFGGGGAASSGGSIFGSANAALSPAAGGSLFSGGNSSGGFGSFSQTSPAPGGFGSGFGGGASVAQTGFGSPQTPQQQPAPGGFGAKPVFGGSPAFGASPTFGGAATFGSPKGFGGFGAAAAAPSPTGFGAAAAKPNGGNIFETLGGQDSGLSFGNLAQTGNSNAQKPAFGG